MPPPFITKYHTKELKARFLCTTNYNTNAGLLDLFKALPAEVKEALNRHGINIKTIQRADIPQNTTPARFMQDYNYGKNAVVEVAA